MTADPPKTTIGRRRPFYAGYADSPLRGAFELGSPIVLIWIASWFVRTLRGPESLWTDDNMPPALILLVLSAVCLLGIWMLSYSIRSTVVEVACPCCGAPHRRQFNVGGASGAAAVACEECTAYLRIEGLEVREETPEGTDAYELRAPRYAPIAGRAADGVHFEFAMPAMCAACGATPASHHRQIEDYDRPVATNGILDDVIDGAVSEVTGHSKYEAGRGSHTRGEPARPTPETAYNDALKRLSVPVCAKHTKDESFGSPPLEYARGRLRFHSYRYYKAFLAENGVDTGRHPLDPGSPASGSPSK